MNGLGSTLFELGQYDAALPSLERALRGLTPLIGSEPAEAKALRPKVAWSLYYIGRHQEALTMFLRAIQAAHESPQLHAGIGWCHLKLAQKEQARAAFQRALELRPGDKGAREGLRLAGR